MEFYTIGIYNQDTATGVNEETSNFLYSTFEKACDAIEKIIQTYKKGWSFVPPNREEMKKKIENRSYVHYYCGVVPKYEDEDVEYLFEIQKMKVVE